jgi:hypothetical protein
MSKGAYDVFALVINSWGVIGSQNIRLLACLKLYEL